jgi:hypothetical protein
MWKEPPRRSTASTAEPFGQPMMVRWPIRSARRSSSMAWSWRSRYGRESASSSPRQSGAESRRRYGGSSRSRRVLVASGAELGELQRHTEHPSKLATGTAQDVDTREGQHAVEPRIRGAAHQVVDGTRARCWRGGDAGGSRRWLKERAYLEERVCADMTSRRARRCRGLPAVHSARLRVFAEHVTERLGFERALGSADR